MEGVFFMYRPIGLTIWENCDFLEYNLLFLNAAGCGILLIISCGCLKELGVAGCLEANGDFVWFFLVKDLGKKSLEVGELKKSFFIMVGVFGVHSTEAVPLFFPAIYYYII